MTDCRICGAGMAPVVDLGHQPLADRFLSAQDLTRPEIRYPLVVELCRCGYAGLSHVVSPEERYRGADYSYTAGNSVVSRQHFVDLAAALSRRLGLGSKDLVVDIGGNDGTLLRAIVVSSQSQVLNVEPASNIAVLSVAAEIPTRCSFWDDACAEAVQDHGGASAVIATNVFNHIADLHGFMRAVTKALRPGGYFVLEVPALRDLVRRGSFDTIYLEHVSYFGTEALLSLLGSYGLGVLTFEWIEYMGGSVRVWSQLQAQHAPPALAVVADEQDLQDLATYDVLRERIARLRTKLCAKLWRVKEEGGVIVGVGAAAKGNTLLNTCKIDRGLLECVADASPHKIGKFTPGSHLPIVADAGLPKDASHALILPWNIAGHLRTQLQHLSVEIVVPVMEQSV